MVNLKCCLYVSIGLVSCRWRHKLCSYNVWFIMPVLPFIAVCKNQNAGPPVGAVLAKYWARGRRTGEGSSCDKNVIRLASSSLPGKTWPVVTSTRSPCDGSRDEAVRHPRPEVVRSLSAAGVREVRSSRLRRAALWPRTRSCAAFGIFGCGDQLWRDALGSTLWESALPCVHRVVAHLWCRRVWGRKGVSNAEEE